MSFTCVAIVFEPRNSRSNELRPLARALLALAGSFSPNRMAMAMTGEGSRTGTAGHRTAQSHDS